MFKFFEKKIRGNYFLYLSLIWIYKKFNFIFFFVEKNQFNFLKKINNNYKNFFILNIGSNHNQNCRIMLKINPNFKIVNFDPNMPKLKNNEFKNFKNVKNSNFGAFNKNIKKKLYIPYYKNFSLDSLSSLSKKNIRSYLNEHKLDVKKIHFKVKLCKFVKLDKFNYQTFFLKVDTEGSEIDVLKGLNKTIKKHNPIILLENNGYKNDKNVPQLKVIINYLKKFKYKSFYYENNCFKKGSKNLNKRDLFFLNNNSFKYIPK